jgi:biotin carboxylase
VEEYLDGPEISIDSVVHYGKVHPLVLARKQTGLFPYFEETGHCVTADDPLLSDVALLDQLQAIHDAISVDQLVTHTEFRLTPDGPRLVEINPRLGGDFIPKLGYLASGINLPLVGAMIAAGDATELISPIQNRTAGVRFLYPSCDCIARTAKLSSSGWPPELVDIVLTVIPGQKLLLPPRGYLSRYAYAMAVADTPAIVATALSTADQYVDLVTDPIST